MYVLRKLKNTFVIISRSTHRNVLRETDLQSNDQTPSERFGTLHKLFASSPVLYYILYIDACTSRCDHCSYLYIFIYCSRCARNVVYSLLPATFRNNANEINVFRAPGFSSAPSPYVRQNIPVVSLIFCFLLERGRLIVLKKKKTSHQENNIYRISLHVISNTENYE